DSRQRVARRVPRRVGAASGLPELPRGSRGFRDRRRAGGARGRSHRPGDGLLDHLRRVRLRRHAERVRERRRAVRRGRRVRGAAQLRLPVLSQHLAARSRARDAARRPLPARRAVVAIRPPAASTLMAAVLETVGLTKTFGALAAASDITVRVEEDDVVGLIGGNGAGKTTFLNLVTGYLRPTHGRIAYRRLDTTAHSPRQATPLGTSRSSQMPQFFDSTRV